MENFELKENQEIRNVNLRPAENGLLVVVDIETITPEKNYGGYECKEFLYKWDEVDQAKQKAFELLTKKIENDPNYKKHIENS